MVNSLIQLLQWKMTIHVIDPSVPVPTHGTFVDAVIAKAATPKEDIEEDPEPEPNDGAPTAPAP